MTYELDINGEAQLVRDAGLHESLLFVLRERLGLPGSKNACEQGECGSCSVFVDGALVCSCLVLAAACAGRTIVTVEGLRPPTTAVTGERTMPGDALTDVQQAFVEAGAVQCGFCTPGLVMSVHHLLATDPTPNELTVREAISGNLCRCTGYGRIFDAVARVVAERTRDDGAPDEAST